jgi:HEAT repeat protein
VDVKSLNLDILRDLYGSSRRLAMYPLGHPVTQDTLKKPMSALNEIFSFKHSFIIELFKDSILAEGILLEDTISVSGLALDMKKHNLSNIGFYSDINIGDLYHLLTLLVSKAGPYEDNVARVLGSKNISSIKVNIENPPNLFHLDRTDLMSDTTQFSLSKRAKVIISKHPGIIAAYYMGGLRKDDDILKHINIDFRLGYLAGYFKDVLLNLEREKAMKLLEHVVFATNWLDDHIESEMLLGLRRLFKDYLSQHPDQKLLSDIYELFKKVGTPDTVMDQIFNRSSVLKLRTFQESEIIVNTLKYADPSQVDPADLRKTLFKLAAAGQRDYLSDLLDHLIRSLSSTTNELRQKALHLVITAGEVLATGGFYDDYNSLCREAVRLALLPTETLEPVELTAEFAWQAIKEKRWQELKFLIRTLKGIRDDHSHPESKRSLASRKFIEISESSLLAGIVSDMMENDRSEDTGGFLEALGNLGSRDIIRTLADKIAHPDINIRSRVIKLLVNMKSESGEILSQMLGEWVAKYEGKEIDEQNWYYLRNILRILRSAQAEEALPYLEIMIGWPEFRLKLEIIKTLEGMPIEDAARLYEKLSGDQDPEIRKATIIAMGLTGHPDMIPRLLAIFQREPDCRVNSIASIGRIGGPQARDKLIDMFEDNEFFANLDLSKREIEQVRVAILKALSRIGDETAMAKLEEYSRKSFSKSLFKKDLLSNTAKIILDTKNKIESK